MIQAFKIKDFYTPYSKDFFRKALRLEGFKVLQSLAGKVDEASQEEWLPKVTSWLREQNNGEADSNNQFPSLILTNGKVLSSSESQKVYEAGTIYKEVRANFVLEQVLTKYRDANSVADVMLGSTESDFKAEFTMALLRYPLEASIIRAEIQHPDILRNEKLHELTIGTVYQLLCDEAKNLDGNVYSAIGIEYGPRDPALTADQAKVLLEIWMGSDDWMALQIQQYLNVDALAKADFDFKQPN